MRALARDNVPSARYAFRKGASTLGPAYSRSLRMHRGLRMSEVSTPCAWWWTGGCLTYFRSVACWLPGLYLPHPNTPSFCRANIVFALGMGKVYGNCYPRCTASHAIQVRTSTIVLVTCDDGRSLSKIRPMGQRSRGIYSRRTSRVPPGRVWILYEHGQHGRTILAALKRNGQHASRRLYLPLDAGLCSRLQAMCGYRTGKLL